MYKKNYPYDLISKSKEGELHHYMVRFHMVGFDEKEIYDPVFLDNINIVRAHLKELDSVIYALGQLELANDTYYHWQMYILSSSELNTDMLRKHLFNKNKVNMYVKRCKSVEDCLRYCTKKESRYSGPYELYRNDINSPELSLIIHTESRSVESVKHSVMDFFKRT